MDNASRQGRMWIGTDYENVERAEIFLKEWHERPGVKYVNGQVERCPQT